MKIMFEIEGQCDWCKKLNMLTKLNYLDGECNYSCKQCYDIARIDVRMFDQGELQKLAREKQALQG